MEKYIIYSVMNSIVEPNKVDVELARDGHFARALRVSSALKNVVPGAECVLHNDMIGAPVAYCFGDEMHIAELPESRRDARVQIAMMLGLIHGSKDRFHFYMAMRAALKNQGVRPGLLPTTNMMRLAELQRNIKGR